MQPIPLPLVLAWTWTCPAMTISTPSRPGFGDSTARLTTQSAGSRYVHVDLKDSVGTSTDVDMALGTAHLTLSLHGVNEFAVN